MSSFKIVNGNINAINEEELGNHTWVEKEEWVYDVTDGMKWRKDAYYSIYQPNIVSVYDNNVSKTTLKLSNAIGECVAKALDFMFGKLDKVMNG